MASPAQIAANRLNATKSTGPRTGAGKAASRLNALRHGGDAQLPVIPGEDPAELEALSADYQDHYRPATPEESFLVDTLVQSEWLRRRLLRIETEMLNHLLADLEPCENPLGALYCSDTPGARALERIRRHYEAANRAWFRALRRLETLRKQAADDLLFGIPPASAPRPVPPDPPEPNWVRSADSSPAAPSAPSAAPRAYDPRLALRL